MKSYNELEALVIAWAKQKGILENGTPYAQSLKTLEEVIELQKAVITKDREETIDALGDILVTSSGVADEIAIIGTSSLIDINFNSRERFFIRTVSLSDF